MTSRRDRGPSRPADDQGVVELSRVVGHEVGELAALFDGYTELVGPAADADAVSGLRRTTSRLREICEDLLELSDVAMSEPVRQTIEPAASLAAAQRRVQDELTVEVREVPAVVADPRHLEQLFAHLLRSLARSGAPSGTVVVSGYHDGSEVRVDIGPDPAGRASNGARRAGSLVGRGLVLALSSQIAARNQGSLRLASNGHSETTISLTLPAGAS